MTRWIMAAGAAALALTAPALAGQDKGKGGGKGGDKAERHDRGDRHGGGKRAERGRGGDDRDQRQSARIERRDDDRRGGVPTAERGASTRRWPGGEGRAPRRPPFRSPGGAHRPC